MKKLCLMAFCFFALSSDVFAADLPTRKSAPINLGGTQIWTGIYAGLNAGYGWGTNSTAATNLWNALGWNEYSFGIPSQRPFLNNIPLVASSVSIANSSVTQSGFLGGLQIGYNYQLEANVLVGFEADFQGSTIGGGSAGIGQFRGASSASIVNVYTDTWTGSQGGFNSTNVTAGISYIGTARGRLGYLISPTLIGYGTAGLAYGGVWANVTNSAASNTIISYQTTIPNALPYSDLPANQGFVGNGSKNSLVLGYTAGGGFEWMFKSDWSLKLEALYYNLGNINVTTTALSPSSVGPSTFATNGFASAAIMTGNTSVNYQGVFARAGVNYHFNFGAAPVVARF